MQRFDTLVRQYPALKACLPDIWQAFCRLCRVYRGGGRLYVCGNGGSEADARHITGELMKGFERQRPIRFPEEVRSRLPGETAALLEGRLQGALPCQALSGESALMTAFANDVDPDLVFAQQVYGYGRPGDGFIGISTSGNSANVCLAAELARAMGLETVALTGRGGGRLAAACETAIRVPAERTAQVQEYHLPVYHALCRALEAEFFGGVQGE